MNLKLFALCLLLLNLPVTGSYAMNHQGMVMDDKGMIMNSNEDKLPSDCKELSETVKVTIHAGVKYAEKFNGKMYAFDAQEWNIKPCSKITITFINDDDIRHQLMIHGLPGYLYPQGMFHLELYGKGQLMASLIVPSQKKTYLVHCELPQHAEKGMKAQLKVDGGDGDLPSIPGISKPVKADSYAVNWSISTGVILLLSLIAGLSLPFLLIAKASKVKNALRVIANKLHSLKKPA